MTERAFGVCTGAVIGLAVLCSHTVAAQQAAASGDPRWGTIAAASSGGTGDADVSPLAAIKSASSFKSAQYSSGGVGLRNLGTGTLHISGVTTPVKAAYLYWAVITQGAALTPDKTVTIQRTFPAGGKSITLTGTLLGTGPSPCWLKTNTISVFKATVPLANVTGNGAYQIAFGQAGASGSTKGEDPWLAAVPPLLEGASLVVVGTGSGTVSVFDKGIAGHTFGTKTNPETFSYTLSLPSAATGGQVLFETIGADGQIGSSRTAGNVANSQPYIALKATQVNNQIIAGPYNVTYIDYDADWNGNAAAPLPRLWDDVGHDITNVAPSGTSTLNISFTTNGDCLTPVANVVATF